jgi:2Fe-2S ferredoxin
MAHIVYHLPGGDSVAVEVPAGTTLMRAALQNDVPGIVGECGGQAMCATCHVLVRRDFLGQLPPPTDDEEDMLAFQVPVRDEERSRLGCQIHVAAGERLEVDVPESQY